MPATDRDEWPVPPRLSELRPEALDRLAEAGAVVNDVVDSALLAIVRERVAMLLGCDREIARQGWPQAVEPAVLDAVADWPTDPRFSERDRDTLSFVEQYVIDVASVDDAMVARMARHFDGDDAVRDFVVALYLAEFTLRLRMADIGLLRAS